MKKKSKRTLTPKLRFPEFRDESGWEESTVGELVATVSPPKKLTTSQYFSEGRFPIIDQSPDDQCGWTNDDNALIENSLPLIVFGDHTCVLKLVNQPFAQGADGIKIFRPKRSVSTEYLYHFLCARPLVMESYKRHFSILKGRQVFYPEGEEAEQQKIAECLGSLDGLIAAEGRKLAALRDHKRGLMQQLFPQPGETQPRLRFPEFQNARSAFRPIGTFAKVTTGNKDTQNKVDDGEYPFFVRSQNVERIDSFSHDCEAVLTSGDGVGVGENYHYLNGKFDFHQRVYCIYNFTQSVNGQFFFHYFSTHFKKRVKEMSAKNSVDSVRMAMITEMPIWMPPPPEQQKIAACLTALDTRIAAQAGKIDALQQHKRGLMQQLFPAPEVS